MRRIAAFVACLVMSTGVVVPAGPVSAGPVEPQGLQDLICFMMPWLCRVR